MRIAIAGFAQESQSFSPVPGSWAHFGPHEVLREQEIIRSPLAVNEPEGEWEIGARCPAAGWKETVRVTMSHP